jgi:hypothetical protein
MQCMFISEKREQEPRHRESFFFLISDCLPSVRGFFHFVLIAVILPSSHMLCACVRACMRACERVTRCHVQCCRM